MRLLAPSETCQFSLRVMHDDARRSDCPILTGVTLSWARDLPVKPWQMTVVVSSTKTAGTDGGALAAAEDEDAAATAARRPRRHIAYPSGKTGPQSAETLSEKPGIRDPRAAKAEEERKGGHKKHPIGRGNQPMPLGREVL